MYGTFEKRLEKLYDPRLITGEAKKKATAMETIGNLHVPSESSSSFATVGPLENIGFNGPTLSLLVMQHAAQKHTH